jgi:hypothetical protein
MARSKSTFLSSSSKNIGTGDFPGKNSISETFSTNDLPRALQILVESTLNDINPVGAFMAERILWSGEGEWQVTAQSGLDCQLYNSHFKIESDHSISRAVLSREITFSRTNGKTIEFKDGSEQFIENEDSLLIIPLFSDLISERALIVIFKFGNDIDFNSLGDLEEIRSVFSRYTFKQQSSENQGMDLLANFPASAILGGLSITQTEIAQKLIDGKADQEISAELSLSSYRYKKELGFLKDYLLVESRQSVIDELNGMLRS